MGLLYPDGGEVFLRFDKKSQFLGVGRIKC